MKYIFLLSVLISFSIFSCKPTDPGNSTTTSTTGKPPVKKEEVSVDFNADSAYFFVAKQVSFGPRVPGTLAHGKCADYLLKTLDRFCDTTILQEDDMRSANGKIVHIKNLMGIFNPEAKKRILLAAHYDTRPNADEDKVSPNTPADGANDGASGVGVLLELARQFSKLNTSYGVDIIFFDAEDMGDRRGLSETWCLGSQYWAGNLHKTGYYANEGILLDMVGAKDATFAYEVNSLSFNQPLVVGVWQLGQKLGYGKYFINIDGNPVIDDHQFVQRITGIPMIDIIEYSFMTRSFGEYWHTHDDNMDVIDKETLKAVGHTVLHWTVQRDRNN